MASPRASSTSHGEQDSELVKEIKGIPEGYPATDLVKYLLKNIALDISKFRRHFNHLLRSFADPETFTMRFNRS